VSHEPEVAAAVYLAGSLDAVERERFEEHLLACEECWGEVRTAHRGRALAESLREVAPQPLRERVRASVAAASRSERRRRKRPFVAVAVAATVLAMVAVGLLGRQGDADQPAVITAAAASYRTGHLDGSAATPAQPPVRQAGDLVWRGARQGRLAGLPVVAHDYRDAAGRQVTLLRANRSFPEAAGANHPPGTAIWVAEVDGVAVLCADRPSPSLVVARDPAQALRAASRLGLH
jgi:putative zinc finger protein